MNYRILTVKDEVDWDLALKRLPIDQQDIYFTSQYYKLYQQNGDGEARCFIYENDGKILLYPFLINSVNSLGYELDKEYYDIQGAYGYNGIVTSSNSEKFISEFYKCFYDYCVSENIITEFVRFHPVLKNDIISSKFFHLTHKRSTVVIDISRSYDTIWSNFYTSNNRNMIRKANRNGCKTIVINKPSISDIRQFYLNYVDRMKAVNAEDYYYFNMEYFINLFRFFEDRIYLFKVLNIDGETVCYSIFFHFNNYFHYHLSSRSINAENCVNNYLLDEAVKFAKDLGAVWFHLGGGRSTTKGDTLLKFKENFSKEKLVFHVGEKILNKDVYDIVVNQWFEKHPNSYARNKKLLQGYRNVL